MEKKNDIGLLILRLTIGLLMLPHGLSKLFGSLDGIKGMLEASGFPGFIAYGVILGEVVAPLLVVVGFRTRLASLVLAFNMVVAVMMAHAADLFKLVPMGGWALELQGLFFFGALAIFFTGAGKYALSSANKWD